MANAEDSFSRTPEEIMVHLSGYAALTAIVSARNFIDYASSSRSPAKEQHRAADLPELKLLPASLTMTPQASSSSMEVSLSFELVLSVGDERLSDADRGVLPVVWALAKAMRALWPALLALETPIPRLRSVQWESGDVGMMPNEHVTSVRGWTLTGTLVCNYWFKASDLA